MRKATVKELIEELQQIEDKDKTVNVYDGYQYVLADKVREYECGIIIE